MNAAVRIWVRLIKAGRKALDDVPASLREAVREALEAEGYVLTPIEPEPVESEPEGAPEATEGE